MDIHDLSDFFKLSALLNIQLSATAVGRSNIASVILGRSRVSEQARDHLLATLEYLDKAYGQSRRRLGPMAVLHPLRASALLARTQETVSTTDLITELLHDKLEDITPELVGEYRWDDVEAEFVDLVEQIDPEEDLRLMDRLRALTRSNDETYFEYIGTLVDQAEAMPSLVAVKLADRLDNTLDMRIDIEDPIQGIDFFETVFQLLYVNNFTGYRPDLPHPLRSPLNGAQRLYQLFKNATLLTIIRRKEAVNLEPQTKRLFEALARASIKEAQRIALHIFGYHMTNLEEQRELLLETMEYVQMGGIDRVTLPTDRWRLDGFFASRFDDSDPAVRKARLDKLYGNKALMIEASLAFVVIFLSFLNEPSFRIMGMTEDGMRPSSLPGPPES